MEFSSLHELARSQGPVFWVAAAAIALGATLLLMSLAQLVRHLLADRVKVIENVPPAPAAAPAVDVYVPAAPPVASEFQPQIPTTPARDEDHSLALLLRRLQSAGDRLEEVAGDLWHEEPDGDDSGLKDSLRDVEYVFRASGP